MLGTWKGSYRYDNKVIQKTIGHEKTNFTIEINSFELDVFRGTVQDDPRTGGMNGIGEVKGEVFKESIYFEKQMPFESLILDEHGNRRQSDKKHPTLYYEGILVSINKYAGSWKFDKKWGLWLGIIPMRYCPGKGTWEMELITIN